MAATGATVNAPAPENPELVIRKLNERTTIFSAPFARFGLIPIGGRSTAIKLEDDSLWVVPSTALTPATLTALQELAGQGPGVRHLVTIDREHNIFVPQYIKAFPEAKVYVPSGVKDSWTKDASKKDLVDKITFVFGQGKGDPFEAVTNGEIKTVDFGKSHGNEVSPMRRQTDPLINSPSIQDVAFLHTPTKTLIQADLMFNLPPTEQYSKSSKRSWFPILSGQFTAEGAGHKRLLNMIAKDKSEYAKDVIEHGGKGIWNNLYAKFLQ
ncbi:hypothetical protein OIV83_006356 [Microbotryomycetes sp. JL201]|nr:hypothetical protein OIV83_006356 [Microbotryomycetes sp. JL201]